VRPHGRSKSPGGSAIPVELPLRGIFKEPLELLPVGVLHGCPVHVLIDHRPALGGGEGAELGKLVGEEIRAASLRASSLSPAR
jgi:hypothetical protein